MDFLDERMSLPIQGVSIDWDKIDGGSYLRDLDGYYKGGALLLGSEDGTPVGSIAIRKIDDDTCEAKRLFIKPEFRGKGYARVMLNAMLDMAKELGFKEVTFTTKPEADRFGKTVHGG